MFSVKSKFLKKLAVFFLFLFLVILLVQVISTRGKKYDPVETLEIEEATARVYFSPQVNYPGSDWYQGRMPDINKHRNIDYTLVLKNTGPKKKNFLIAEIASDLNPSFTKLIINDGGDIPFSMPRGTGVKTLSYLAEGDPAEIEKLVEQTKVRILWEEDGKRFEKIVSVSPSGYSDGYYRTDANYEVGETLKLKDTTAYVQFSPETDYPVVDWYKGRQPDPERHRIVAYHVIVTNTGKEIKRFVLVEPILDPSFQKLIINSVPAIPWLVILPESDAYLNVRVFLAEGDPVEIEKFAYQTKLRILWTEGGKKYEKIVEVTPKK